MPAAVDRELSSIDRFVVERALQKLTDRFITRLPGHGPRERLLDSIYVRKLWHRKSIRNIFAEAAIRTVDFDAIRLPDRLFWLYLPLRPFLYYWRRRKRVAV
jgi:hypothetical protein